MKYQTHVATSVTAAIAVSHLSHSPVHLSALLLTGVVIGSIAPDLDHPGSYLGRRSLGIAHLIHWMFGHRGFTHSLIAVALVSIPYFIFHMQILMGLTVGYLFHILGDMFSTTGVPLFHPFSKKRIKIPVYRTGSGMETFILFATAICFVWLIKGEVFKLLPHFS